MPRSEDYNKKTKYDQLFMSMDDDQFLAFVKEDDIEANFNNLTEAEKTAFLIRSLMIGENSTEFKNDVIYRRNYFRENGPKEIDEASNAKENINDPYGSDREFHYDVYRRLIYNDMMSRAIAGNIIRYVSPSEIIKDREKYRDLIVGDLTIPKEADDEITEDLKKGAKDRRKEFLDEIDQKIKDKIDAGKDAEDEEKKAQDPEELLASFDDEKTSPEQKANLLIAYVLRNARKKDAEKAIENLQNQKNMKELIDSYAQNMKSADIKKDEARLHSVITGDSAAQNCAVQLQQKVYKVRKANGKLTNKEQAEEKKKEIAEEKRKKLREEQIKAEKAKEDEEKRIEAEKKQREIDRKNQIEGYFTSGRTIGPDRKGRTWAVYADKHTPSELLQYSDAQKAEMLSKMMVGRRLQIVNGMNQNRIISFNLDSARKLAKDIQNSPAFKEIVRTKEVNTYLAKSKEELADAAMGVFHPFNKVPFEKKQEILENLKKMAPFIDGERNRSEEWKRFKRSVDKLNNFELQNSSDSRFNGEDLFEEIFNSSAAYMKGKKSLRKNEENQNRFNQALDFMAELSKASPYAELAYEGTINRINVVRRGHDRNATKLYASDFGARRIDEHTNKRVVNKVL